jgi:hypothetical protein
MRYADKSVYQERKWLNDQMGIKDSQIKTA